MMIGCPPALALAAGLAAVPPPPEPPPPMVVPSSSASELEAEAPVPAWRLEGRDEGDVSGDAWTDDDEKKLRAAAGATVVGTGIAILGAAGLVAGSVLYSFSSRNAALARPAPIVLYTSGGVAVIGAVTAVVGGTYFRRYRERKRTSTLAIAPVPLRRGAGLGLGVRF